MATKPHSYRTLDVDLLDAYPDVWGPLPDPEMQEKPQWEIMDAVRSWYGQRSDVFVSGNTGIYYEEGNPNAVVRPDCYVVFGEGAERLWNPYAYRIWDFGATPAFVLEVGSKSTWQNDLGYKRDLYARLGVAEYWRYDPSGGDYYGEPLAGEYLERGEYQRFELQSGPDGMILAHSPVLQLELRVRDLQLEFHDPETGEILVNAIVQRERRLAAEAEVARLQAELRRLRGE